jgi:serine phosphatase RsbU (regulator of sigma subunit)
MKAAMIAVMSSGMVHSRADGNSSPGEILTHLNRPIFIKTDDTMFTALCLASVDISAKIVTYALAGMNEPVLKSNDSVGIIRTARPGLPLGAFSESEYGEDTVQLNPDDVLLLFTDGIIEAQNNLGDFYDYHRLIDLITGLPTDKLSARLIKDKIIEDVNNFVGNAEQQDDMTVVVVKCT